MLFLLIACGGAFFGTSAEPPEPPAEAPKQVKVPKRPPECETAMQLITGCGVSLVPSRVQAVAECEGATWAADTELAAFIRCLGDNPDCEALARCSGPIVPTEVARPQ